MIYGRRSRGKWRLVLARGKIWPKTTLSASFTRPVGPNTRMVALSCEPRKNGMAAQSEWKNFLGIENRKAFLFTPGKLTSRGEFPAGDVSVPSCEFIVKI